MGRSGDRRILRGRRVSRRTASFLRLGALAGGALACSLLYAREVEPYWLKLERLTLTLPRLAPSFDRYRIVQISDIHMDGWMTPERLGRVVDLVNEQERDLVVITGDFVSGSARYISDLSDPLRKLWAPDGAVAVLGNHDHLNDADAVREVLSSTGITDVSNAVRTLRRNDTTLHLCGVDCVMYGYDRLDKVLEALKGAEPGCAVLLAHEPDFVDRSAASGRFDLQLSGHSHGGQVRIPFLGAPIFVPPLSLYPDVPPLASNYPSGLYTVKKMYQYTNRGLGAMSLRLRLNCRPEITVLTLRSPQ
jgi:predicted MPP superfamily phosphohydrolase